MNLYYYKKKLAKYNHNNPNLDNNIVENALNKTNFTKINRSWNLGPVWNHTFIGFSAC